MTMRESIGAAVSAVVRRLVLVLTLVLCGSPCWAADAIAKSAGYDYDGSANAAQSAQGTAGAGTTPTLELSTATPAARSGEASIFRSSTTSFSRSSAAKGAGRVAGDAKGFIGPGGHRNIPSDWVTRPSRGGRGQRSWDPNNPKGNYVRIEEDAINGRHVHVTSGGKQVLHDGDRHIPFEVWDNWSTFGGP